ncbi:cysteine dioxygenase family protein [Candidatus Kapabacteria bacterium]|nr:cysteine dioxygenase family protein [Candidatus Kapabacteria bacterium]
MEKIKSIDKLIYILENCESSDFHKIPRSIDIPVESFNEFAHFSDQFYTRNCIAKNTDFELLLLCWNPGQKTPIHCHDSQECWVMMIDGELEEDKYSFEENASLPKKINQSQLYGSQISFMSDDLGYHLLGNIKSKKAMSLHLYVNPINKCSTLCPDTGEIKWIETSYHSYKGELVNN